MVLFMLIPGRNIRVHFERFIGQPPPELRKGAVSVIWLHENICIVLLGNATNVQLEYIAHRYILHMIAFVQFSNSTKSYASLRWLPYLADLQQCGRCSWRSVVLASMYHQLTKTTLCDNNGITLYFTLSQVRFKIQIS